MAFVYEDGTGFANSNSLASVAFADSYHDERGNAAWAALSLERKQQLLIIATDYVTDVYGRAFEGNKAVNGQALPFPRIINSVNFDNSQIVNYMNVVNYVNVGNPVGVQRAVAELALIANSGPLTTNTTRGKKRVKIGPLEVEYDGTAPTQTLFVSASLKLVPFLKAGTANGRQVRLTRA